MSSNRWEDPEKREISRKVQEEFYAETGFRVESAAQFHQILRRMGKLRLVAFLWIIFSAVPAFFGVGTLWIGLAEGAWLTAVAGAALLGLAGLGYVRGFKTLSSADREVNLIHRLDRRIAEAVGEKRSWFKRSRDTDM